VLVAMLFGLIVPWSDTLPWSVRLVERVNRWKLEAGSWKGRWSRVSMSGRKDVSGAGKADGGQGEVRAWWRRRGRGRRRDGG
jgi:hypothetical protein